MVKKGNWLEEVRAEYREFLERHGIKPKKYHYIKWDDMGCIVEYQKEEGGPIYVRNRSGEWVERKVKKHGRKS